MAVLLIFCCVSFYYLLFLRLDLPSDEEMISHFQENQVDFEEVVKRYRYSDEKPSKALSQQNNTSQLMKRIKIEQIYPIGPRWILNPYSLEAARDHHAKTILADKISDLNGTLSSDRNARSYKYGTIRIKLSPYKKWA